jgi:sporulation protein YlmC with PRC-barrel domain
MERMMSKFLLAAVAIAALSGATALAQAPSPGANPAPANTANSPGSAANPPANAPTANAAQNVPAKGPDFIQVKNDDMLSLNVVGLDIYNKDNNNIGKIQDVVFDKSNKIVGFILSVGGFLGMGTHYVAVDPDALSIAYDTGNKTWRASMNASKDQLKAAPEFKYGGQWTASRS